MNDGTIWRCNSFDAPPPKLRRAMSSNAMRDGVFVSSSQYESRRIVARFQIFRSSRDLAAVQLQLLARELDRTDNYLKLQHDGASKPVFFKLYRSDSTAIRDIPGQASAYECEVEFLAEPFALGLRESAGPYTLNNDPAAASNGHYIDITGVIGDVAAPCVLVNTGDDRACGRIAVRQHGTPSDMDAFYAFQAEDATLGTDTTDPGGGPDAAMSGAGTNNYARTSFATLSTLSARISQDFTFSTAEGLAAVGAYRVLAVVRRSDNTSDIRVRAAVDHSGIGARYTSAVAVPKRTNRQVVDLGLLSLEPPARRIGAYNSSELGPAEATFYLDAGRDSGAGTLDWDYALLLPADEAQMVWRVNGSTSDELVIDGGSETVFRTADGVDPFDSTATITGAPVGIGVAGGFPSLVPNQTNRFYYIAYETDDAVVKGDTSTWSVHYWPRYLSVRPSAS